MYRERMYALNAGGEANCVRLAMAAAKGVSPGTVTSAPHQRKEGGSERGTVREQKGLRMGGARERA